MKIISSKVHGYIDYIVGLLLIAAPYIFNFSNSGPASIIPMVLGISTITYSLLTQYELGAVKAIKMKVHLAIDFIAGAFLAVSPWLFGFSDVVFWPHVIVGAGEVLVVILTNPNPTGDFMREDSHTYAE